MKEKPAITVVIPTHNRPELVSGAIESVLEQIWQDFEIIVIDDGLEKRARSMVETFNDERIHYIEHQENKGCSAAKNTGMQNAQGKYIAILDDDDRWYPQKLEKQYQALEEVGRDVGFSFTAVIEEFENRQGRTQVPEGVGDYLDFALCRFSGLIDSAMVYRREVFETVGGLDETYPTHTGAEYAIRVARAFKGVGINEPLVWRDMRQEYEHMGSDIQKRIRGRGMLLEQYCEEFEKRPAYLAKHLTQLARFYRDVGEYKKARENIKKALSYGFSFKRVLQYLMLLGGGAGYKIFYIFWK